MRIINLGLILIFLFTNCFDKCKGELYVCTELQKRAEECEGEILEIFRNFIKENENNGRTDFDFILIESRVKKKIAQKQGQKQCERYRLSKNKDELSRYNKLKHCVYTKSCRDFASCIISF
ncbi:MAG: hypothetical protein N2746_02880 [Deltaproteobacteria bacterium]|nr:hypothetical protein [Deltaproteobacteria bacterium]